jgi:hypothetical protein
MPVTLALPPACPEPEAPEDPPVTSSPRPDAEEGRRDDRIEIEMGNGRLVRVGAGVGMDALKRIIELLDRPDADGKAAGVRQ